jgi:transcriptional regulator with XRE-family HTH domain
LSLSQTEFLARAGLDHHVNWLSDVEHGKHSIDPHELKRLADAAGFPVDWFLDPQYDRRPVTAPMTRVEWERIYADPERAEIHWQIDQLLRRVLDRISA